MQVNNASRGIRLRRLVPPGDKILEEQKKREEEERKKKEVRGKVCKHPHADPATSPSPT